MSETVAQLNANPDELVRMLVILLVPTRLPPFTLTVPVAPPSIVTDAATVLVPVPRLIVPPELVIPAFIVPVHAVLLPNVPVLVSTPPFWKVPVVMDTIPAFVIIPVVEKAWATSAKVVEAEVANVAQASV